MGSNGLEHLAKVIRLSLKKSLEPIKTGKRPKSILVTKKRSEKLVLTTNGFRVISQAQNHHQRLKGGSR